MEPVTHALSGIVLRNLGFRKKAALAVLVMASVAADADYFSMLWGADVYLRYHRGLSHGVLALFTVPLVFAYLFRKRGGFTYYYVAAFAAYGFHLFLDLTNQYGTRIISPMDWRQVSLDLTFIIDPYILFGFAASIGIAALRKDRARVISAATIALLLFYLGVKNHYHDRTEEFLRASMQDHIVRRVSPMPNNFLRWWFVADTPGETVIGFSDLFTKRIYVHERFPRQFEDDYIEMSKKNRVVKNFLYFAKLPLAQTSRDGDVIIVRWRELSYAYASGDHFVATVKMNKYGDILSSEFRF